MKMPTKLDAHTHEQILAQTDGMFSVIEHFALNEYEVKEIVREWYTNGMCKEILQDECGNDLEEIL